MTSDSYPSDKQSAKDRIYANPLGDIVDFAFDEQVVSVFADMINRSVPGYSTIVKSLGILAARHGQPDSRYYDLGCSLGAATLSMLQQVQATNARFIAVDSSAPMIERCREHLQVANVSERVELLQADIREVEIGDAAVVVMNFTLQFVPPADREALLARIYQGLKPGGVLLLSEKIRLADNEADARMIDWYHDFKRANGYSELEISQKRNALENVLQPETLEAHRERLQAIGFSHIQPWFQCFNFISLAAIK